MKLKYIMMAAIVLAVLTVGAVGASSDGDNLTVDDAGGEDIVVPPETDDDLLLENDDSADVIAEGDDSNENEEKITNYTYKVDIDDVYLARDYYYVDGELPEDASGEVVVEIDGSPDSTEIDEGRFYYNLGNLDLSFGPHNASVIYAGDEKYAGFTYHKAFEVVPIKISVPDEIRADYYDNDWGDFWIPVIKSISGNVTVWVDDEKIIDGPAADFMDFNSDEDYTIYYISVYQALKGKPFAFGQHTYNITYAGEDYATAKAGSFNATYRTYVGIDEYYDDEVPYGADTYLTVEFPSEIPSVLVSINGADYEEYALDDGDAIILLKNLTFGANTVAVRYDGDDEYPQKIVMKNLTVVGLIDYGYTYHYKGNEVFSIELPADATGYLAIYVQTYDEYDYEYKYVFVEASPISNGRANISLANWEIGYYDVLVKCENSSYKVMDLETDIRVVPNVIYSPSASVGETVNFIVEIPENSTKQLKVSIFDLRDEEDEWYEDGCEIVSYTDEFNITLDTSEAHQYMIIVKYGDAEFKYPFNVFNFSRDWELNVNFPAEVLSSEEYREIYMRPPDHGDGTFSLYIDGHECGRYDLEYHSCEFYPDDLELGTHAWEIRYYGDSYYSNESQNGTFDIVWAYIPDVVEVGGLSQYAKVGFGQYSEGSVILFINGEEYGEFELEWSRAEILLENLTQGETYNYTFVYDNMTKSGQFRVSYVFYAEFTDDETYMEYSDSHELRVFFPEGATGNVTVTVNGNATYSAEIEDGVATLFMPLAWYKNSLTIFYGGNDEFEAKQINKRVWVQYAVIKGNYENGTLVSVSLKLPEDANGTLYVEKRYESSETTSTELINGSAIIYLGSFMADLPVGITYINAYYSSDDYDYNIETFYKYISVAPDVNITSEISEGEDCIILVNLPGSNSNVELYLDDEYYGEYTFNEGILNITVSGLTAGDHVFVFHDYWGGDYSYPFEYYDEEEREYYPYEYNVHVRANGTLIEPDFAIEIFDVEEGTPITVIVNANEAFTGDVIVNVDGNDILIHIDYGYGCSSTNLTLPASTYTATLDFNETETFASAHAETTFEVTEASSQPVEAGLVITVSDVDLGDDAVIFITINSNADGIVMVNVCESNSNSIFVPGFGDDDIYNKTFAVQIMNGQANLTLSDLTSSGKYNVAASYGGNDQVLSDEATVSFRVLEDANLTMAFNDIEEGEDFIVNFTMNYKSGTFNIDVIFLEIIPSNAVAPLVSMSNGKAQANLTGLTAGAYTIRARFSGNDYYRACEITDSFRVTPQYVDTHLNATVENITEGENATVTVTIDEYATGTLTVTVNDQTQTKSIDAWVYIEEPGQYNFTFENLPAGTHEVLVDFSGTPQSYVGNGSAIYSKPANVTTSIYVKPIPVSANMTVLAEDITEGENATVIVLINEAVTGKVTIAINGRNETIEIDEGMGTYVISGLAADEYAYEVSFEGDEYFLSDVQTVTFQVFENHDANLTVTAEDVFVGENVTVHVSINENATGEVVIVVDGEGKVIDIVNGKGTYTFENLTVGVHSYNVTFAGDGKFLADEKTVSFKVKPHNAIIEVVNGENEYKNGNFTFRVINTDDGSYVAGEQIQLTVINGKINSGYTAVTDANGIASIETKKLYKFDMSLVGGNMTLMMEYLGVGNHLVKLELRSKEYNATARDVNLTIVPANIRITIDEYEEYFGSDKNLTFTATNVNGEVIPSEIFKVQIPQLDYEGYISTDQNGTGTLLVNKLYSGVYDVIISNNDTVNIVNVSAKANFTIKAYDLGLNVSASNITEGENATVNICFNDTFSGMFILNVDGNESLISADGGQKNIVLTSLKAGEHTVTVTFAGDGKFKADNRTVKFNVAVKPINPNLEISVEDIVEGDDAVVTVTTNNTFSGIVKVQIGSVNVDVNVTDGYGNATVSGLAVGNHIAVATFEANEFFTASVMNDTFSVAVRPVDPTLTVSVGNITVGEDAVVTVTTDAAFSGIVKVQIGSVNVDVNVTDGYGNATVSGLAVGNHTAVATFDATEFFTGSVRNATFEVSAKQESQPDIADNVTIPETVSEDAVKISMPPGATGTVLVSIDGGEYISVPIVNGVASVDTSKLPEGKHTIAVKYEGDGNVSGFEKTANITVTVIEPATVPAKIVAKDLEAYYNNVKYSVTVYGTDGKVAKNAQVVFKINGKKVGTAKTNSKGVATIKLKELPKTYKITSEALGKSVTKKLTVKQVLTLKKASVKRSAKKLVIKATLKEGKKALRGKKITFKFNGKKYKAVKTNNKGIAKITVKKAVLKKLKVGKKVKYQATYIKDTVTKSVKVKK